MRDISVNGCTIRPFTNRGDGNGRMSYHIVLSKEVRGTIAFPSDRVLKRLARLYLDCELTPEEQIMPKHWHSFTIDAGISYERRAAFLAAVVTNSKQTKP